MLPQHHTSQPYFMHNFNSVYVHCRISYTHEQPFLTTESDVYAIKFDRCYDHLFLFADGHSIKEYDWNKDGEVSLKAGNPLQSGSADETGFKARFNRVNDFMQLESECDVWLLADNMNHCIRRFNRVTAVIQTVYGRCEEMGDQDGYGTAARFRFPSKIISDKLRNQHAWILERAQLRRVNLATGQVEGSNRTYSIEGAELRSMAWHGSMLIVATNKGIYKYDFRFSRSSLISAAGQVQFTDMQAIQPTDVIIIGSENYGGATMLNARTGNTSMNCLTQSCNLVGQWSVAYSRQRSLLLYGLNKKIVEFTGKTFKIVNVYVHV